MMTIAKEMKVLGALLLILGVFVVASIFAPIVANAFPFGGQIQNLIRCKNAVTYVTLSAPNPGPYIWTPSTRTYDFGPPQHGGQWLLGLAGAPIACVVSTFPLRILPGAFIMMMGSSQ